MTKICRRLLIALAFIYVAVIGSHQSSGFSYYLLGGAPVVWNGALSVRYLSPSTFPEGSDPDIQLRSAMGAWNLVPAGGFTYSYVRLDQDPFIDNFDGYSDTAAVPAWQLDPGVLGVTYLVNSGANWFDADIVFSDSAIGSGYNFDLFPTCDVLRYPTQGNGYSFLLIALHELGHGIGLGHDPIGNEAPNSNWFVATMNPRYPSGGTLGQENIIELHTDDRNAARYLYPHSGPSGPRIADLALAMFAPGGAVGKVEPLSFVPSQAYPGDEIIARSVLENLGTSNEFFVRQGFYLSPDRTIHTGDISLGSLNWDLAFGDAFQFQVAIPLPEDISSGTYYLGSILDDFDEVDEQYEDNNAVVYCEPLIVERLSPMIEDLGRLDIPCTQSFVSPRPNVTHPLNMAPITWSLDNPQPGMTINSSTGVVRWPSPLRSDFLYTIFVRATNSVGSTTQVMYLGVAGVAPQILTPPNDAIGCGATYTGPRPQLLTPRCMEPILLWILDSGPPGMTIDSATGVVTWNEAAPSPEEYVIRLRAINSSGAGSVSWRLAVLDGDLDNSGAIDPRDLRPFLQCLAGPDLSISSGCDCADLTRDDRVDLRDVGPMFESIAP